MLVFATNTWPGIIAVVLILSITAVLLAVFRPAPPRTSSTMSTERLDGIDDDLALIRADLADIKQAIAELDRVLKSVG